MKWFVTGCHGFLGASFSAYAVSQGHEVLGVARSSQSPLNWKGSYLSSDVAVSDLSGAFRDFQPDAVLHGAGSASVAASFKSPHDDFNASMKAWSNVLDSIRRSGTQPKVFFPSSAAVYGQPQTLPVTESAMVRPLSPYGYHKYGGEVLAESYARFFGVRVALLRLFSVFGFRQRKLFLWEVYRQIQHAAFEVELSGTGRETRDFLHVDDLASVILNLAKLPLLENSPLLLNVGRGEEQSVLSVARAILQLSGSSLPVKCKGETRVGDPDRWLADTTSLRSLLPRWRPRPFAESLQDTVAAWSKSSS